MNIALRFAVVILSLGAASVSHAAKWRTVTTNDMGIVVGVSSEADCLASHTYAANEYPDNYDFPTCDYKYWKRVGKDFVSMNDAEKATRDSALQIAKKTVTQRKYENQYFLLVKTVLTLSGDPRKDITPIPKLGFEELDSMLDALADCGEAAKEKAASKLAMKLLKVNAALVLYDIQWWDGAVWHDEIP